jgi:dihydroxyacetone kinase-like protein
VSLRIALVALADRFAAAEEHLNRLDAATGDGDHGSTMARGMAAVAAAVQSLPQASTERVLLAGAGDAFLSSAGGASGALFGSLLLEFAQHEHWPARLEHGAQRVAARGKARAGDKSMLDALLPAAAAMASGSLPAAARAAADGAQATVPMAAQRGRARYVEHAGVGHIDPGAVSIALMLETLAEQES